MMTQQKAKLIDLLQTWIPTPLTSGAVQIASSDELSRTFERYGERVYTYYGEAAEGAQNIAARWELFKALHTVGIERLYEAMSAQYKPLENYNMTERGTNTDIYTDSVEHTGTVTSENNRENTTADTRTSTTNNTGTVTSEDTGTVTSADTGTVTDNSTVNTNNSVYAYDSGAATPRDTTATTTQNTRTDNTTNTRTDNTTNTRTDNTTEQTTHGGTVTDNESGTNTTTNNLTDTTTYSGDSEHTLTRSGNIGVTTSQQMLESEINLRVKNSVIYYAVELFVSQNCTW